MGEVEPSSPLGLSGPEVIHGAHKNGDSGGDRAASATAVDSARIGVPPTAAIDLEVRMTGPAAAHRAQPGPSDRDLDGDVDMDDLRLLQSGGGWDGIGPMWATQCNYGHKYCYIVTPTETLTGVRARIESWGSSAEPTLCGEAQGETASASSAAWTVATLLESGAVTKWAQMGYHRSRGYVPGVPVTQIVKRVYAETKWGPGATDIDIHSPSSAILLSGNRTYTVSFNNPTFGGWQFWYPDTKELFHQFTNAGWAGVDANRYDYAAEIWNTKDHMVGDDSNKALWDQCEFEVGGGGYEPTTFAAGDVFSSDSNQWGIQRLSAQSFEVWDKVP
jgi:hypothetical protein